MNTAAGFNEGKGQILGGIDGTGDGPYAEQRLGVVGQYPDAGDPFAETAAVVHGFFPADGKAYAGRNFVGQPLFGTLEK